MAKYLTYDGLLFLAQKLAVLYVAQEAGKGLSSNDFTSEDKAKIAALAAVATSGSFNDLSDKPTIPTNNNQLGNGAGYQTAAQVTTAIANALSGITGVDFKVVESLPATGEKGIFYLLQNAGGSYDEYIWLTDGAKFEKIGTTDVDLSGYLAVTDVVAITNAEIDTAFAGA